MSNAVSKTLKQEKYMEEKEELLTKTPKVVRKKIAKGYLVICLEDNIEKNMFTQIASNLLNFVFRVKVLNIKLYNSKTMCFF